MAPASLKAIFAPTEKTYRIPARGNGGLVKDSFTLTTLLVFGGLAQSILSLILPTRYALLPLAFLVLRGVVLTVRDITSPAKYASERGVIPGRSSAQLPNASYDSLRPDRMSPFGSAPAEQGVVVFHIGARFNHPLGALSPGGKAVGDQFIACNEDLLKRAGEYGCLGGTSYRGDETASNNTILTVYYFRDLDGLNRFASDDIHRQAWNWYNNEFVKKWGYSHVGIFHEAFCVPAGGYESIYVNMQPTLMGTGNAVVKNEATGKDEWVRTMVDASSSLWRSQHSRMGREVKRQTEVEKN